MKHVGLVHSHLRRTITGKITNVKQHNRRAPRVRFPSLHFGTKRRGFKIGFALDNGVYAVGHDCPSKNTKLIVGTDMNSNSFAKAECALDKKTKVFVEASTSDNSKIGMIRKVGKQELAIKIDHSMNPEVR